MADIQQPDIIGNYLQQYYGAKDRQQQQADAQFQKERQMKQDSQQSQMFDMNMSNAQIERGLKLAKRKYQLLGDVMPGDVQGFEAAKAQYAQEAGVPLSSLSGVTIDQLGQLREQGGQEIAHLDVLAKKSGLATDQAQRSLIGAQTDAARANADYIRTNRGMAGGRPLTSPMNKEFGTLGDQRSQIQNAAASFKPEYASRGIFGFGADLMNAKDRTLGGSDAATWWQGYDRYKNVVRNELFGASLTAGEKAAFEAADITPGMDAATITKNLALQQSIIDGALGRRARSAVSQGFNRDAIMELTGLGGMDNGGGGAPPPHPAGAGGPPPVVTTKAQFDALPSGTVYVESDGKRYRKP